MTNLGLGMISILVIAQAKPTWEKPNAIAWKEAVLESMAMFYHTLSHSDTAQKAKCILQGVSVIRTHPQILPALGGWPHHHNKISSLSLYCWQCTFRLIDLAASNNSIILTVTKFGLCRSLNYLNCKKAIQPLSCHLNCKKAIQPLSFHVNWPIIGRNTCWCPQ